MNENLFSYGTLRNETVQLEVFGRTVEGNPDILAGYKPGKIKIEDEKVIASSGLAYHPILTYTGCQSDIVEGTVFAITETELGQADDYEGDAYKRVLVLLESGKQAWVYISATKSPG